MFTRWPVTLLTGTVYIGLFAALLYVHHVVPAPPAAAVPVPGINVTEAWHDLQTLSEHFHPYNSEANDRVRDWLLSRIDAITKGKNVTYHTGNELAPQSADTSTSQVTIINDIVSNFTHAGTRGRTSVYFEGTNIIVYLRGSEDTRFSRDVLVNAHYDSVSTGFGATDDGVGVVTILQLLAYFLHPDHEPSRGIIFLLNNGEEDYLNGANAFAQHPISSFPDTFLNLEGAGAGGRAVLFRSTDAEVTKFYKDSPYPFGSVLSADGFNRGLVQSQTDYIVFRDKLGLRGLDVAFFEPRARYHTADDSTRGTSKASLWHMLSAAIETTRGLVSDTKTDFHADVGSEGVWFDLFGRAFGLMYLQTLFGLTIALLIVPPLALIGLIALLVHQDRFYLFARKMKSDPMDPEAPDDESTIALGGWKGLFRFPIAFLVASAAVIGMALVLAKTNPFIVYSSEYSVWSMFISLWFTLSWFLLRGADYMRPTALQRAHTFGWLFLIFWVSLIGAAVAENNFKIAGVYFLPIIFALVFVCLAISYLEFLALPTKQRYRDIASHAHSEAAGTGPRKQQPLSLSSSRLLESDLDDRPGSSDRLRPDTGTGEPSETTSLLGRGRTGGASSRLARTSIRQRSQEASQEERDKHTDLGRPFGEEQGWSAALPAWLWILQFIIIGPITVILVGQVALLLTSALHQTLADGSSALTIYLSTAVLAVIILLPLSPFMHRVPRHIPIFLLLVFVGTLIYNLVAFPFSQQNPLKIFFIQNLDLDSGLNTVTLTGPPQYIHQISSSIPSSLSSSNSITCSNTSSESLRKGLRSCFWPSLAPDIDPQPKDTVLPTPPSERYKTWLSINATRHYTTPNSTFPPGSPHFTKKHKRGGKPGKNYEPGATFLPSAVKSRACRLRFNKPIVDFSVTGAAAAEVGEKIPPGGTQEIRLWSREWGKRWVVDVYWDDDEENDDSDDNATPGLDGEAICLWSDVNTPGIIPAFDEVEHYLPSWAVVTKLDDGLLEGKKKFLV